MSVRLSKNEAIRVKDECLKSLKDSLIERANIIQSRLDDENAVLARRQVPEHPRASLAAYPTGHIVDWCGRGGRLLSNVTASTRHSRRKRNMRTFAPKHGFASRSSSSASPGTRCPAPPQTALHIIQYPTFRARWCEEERA
jgi:hypothetical protein